MQEITTSTTVHNRDRTPFFSREISEAGFEKKRCVECGGRKVMPKSVIRCGKCISERFDTGFANE